jgi:formate dehydrogenase gamma subunit
MIQEKKYLRMTVNERIQHFLLLSSFLVLILTGFGLKFPEAFWVKWIVAVVGVNAFEARSLIHRIAALVMISASLYHLGYILFTQRGKKLVKDFLPCKQDIKDFTQSMLYLTGKTEKKPKFGRFSYIEKMEYWAVVWGTVIMGTTGFILWFENFFLKFVSNTGMDIATAIHYYEAILASLAILVWHFYFVFFNPDVFPMNKAWFKGFLTKEEMEKEHPLELEELENLKPENTGGAGTQPSEEVHVYEQENILDKGNKTKNNETNIR